MVTPAFNLTGCRLLNATWNSGTTSQSVTAPFIRSRCHELYHRRPKPSQTAMLSEPLTYRRPGEYALGSRSSIGRQVGSGLSLHEEVVGKELAECRKHFERPDTGTEAM